MKPIVSFLIGSGFSIPENLPSTNQLNQRLSKINEEEILIHTDQHAMFLNGQIDPNRWSRMDERLFVQEFLEFYNSEILKSGEKFHYETFYDFYSGYLDNNENKEVLEAFVKRFNDKHVSDPVMSRDSYNRISDFNRTYNQLIASQLQKAKYFDDASTLNYPPYDHFIRFLLELLKSYDLKIHTLNHDLFFDWLGHHHADLWQYFSDGYQLEGSPFYGLLSHDFNQNTDRPIVHKTYYVKLERFVDKFNKPICFYKLHGSVFNTIIYTPQKDRIRLKDNYGINRFYIEQNDPKTGEPKMEILWDEVAPDFLSGTTNKTRYYSRDPYYKILFNYFEDNLSSSEMLIVIGYGFKDPGINEYIEKHFIAKGKVMYVIDPSPPNDLTLKYHMPYIQKGITNISFEDFIKLIPTSSPQK